MGYEIFLCRLRKKIALFPNLNKRTIQKILITIEGADQSLIDRAYFYRIITLQEILDITN